MRSSHDHPDDHDDDAEDPTACPALARPDDLEIGHRAIYRLTGGRLGLRPASERQWGMLRLRTVGRRSGKERIAIVGFIQDGPNLVTPAMNGWGGPRAVVVAQPPDQRGRDRRAAGWHGPTRRGQAAVGEERARLWAAFLELGSSAFTDASAALRSRETAIVVLEPRPE